MDNIIAPAKNTRFADRHSKIIISVDKIPQNFRTSELWGVFEFQHHPMAVIKQVCKQVIHFSSQYGSDHSRSYTASNLAGEALNYPNYGDFTQSFVLVSNAYYEQYLYSIMNGRNGKCTF